MFDILKATFVTERTAFWNARHFCKATSTLTATRRATDMRRPRASWHSESCTATSGSPSARYLLSLSHKNTCTHTLSLSHTHTYTHTLSLIHTHTLSLPFALSLSLSLSLSIYVSLSLSFSLNTQREVELTYGPPSARCGPQLSNPDRVLPPEP